MITKAAVIGKPVTHSLSPVMHNAAYEYLGMNWHYDAIEVEEGSVEATLREMFNGPYGGVNITMPHKQEAFQVCDHVFGAAQRLGAVNTIIKKDNELHGYSTDGEGFINSLLSEGVKVSGATILIIGAGGAAGAICDALFQNGSKVYVAARSEEKSEFLVRSIKSFESSSHGSIESVLFEELEQKASESDVIVNVTPVGMVGGPEGIPMKVDGLRSSQVVIDTIYYPLETEFIRQANAKNLKVINGIPLLLHQGVIAFELMTGSKAPIEVMRKALDSQLR